MQPVAKPKAPDPILVAGIVLAFAALLIGLFMRPMLRQPGYTDAYYYFNAAQRLAHGQGLTDAALWTYFGLPASLPAPSHLYWMPLASVWEALGGGGSGAGFSFQGAQWAGICCYAALVALACWVGGRIGGSARTAWLAGLLTMFSGFFFPYWVTTDTFALYGLVGAGALAAMGMGRTRGGIGWWALAGALCGLAHLTRADGLLLVIVLVIVALWPRFTSPDARKKRRSPPVVDQIEYQGVSKPDGKNAVPTPYSRFAVGTPFLASANSENQFGRLLASALIGVAAYLLVMLPWFVRNLNVAGSILPVGGLQTAWMRSYDQIATYPPGASLSDFLAWGFGNILQSRWQALVIGAQTLIAVEGWIVLAPLMLFALWRRRFDPFLSAFMLYAVGLHAAMTLLFALPGERGGLFHSAAALIPFWAALGALGLDDVLTWAARRRRWPLAQAKRVFGAALIIYAILFSGLIGSRQFNGWNANGALYKELGQKLPSNAVVMVNDPPAFYYQTGLSAVVLPDSPPDVIPELASKYGVTHVILDVNRTAPMDALYTGHDFPPFLKLIDDQDGVRIFEVNR